ncbi:serine/threonine-protein kinase [Microbacterium telephonicum]|uniref:non-specific serine/threonine protein kinase n=1 Tax=Microbacterium telephonicum TaxID=1714841 RepID=A0A498CJS0_9MICO|nr:serine/threonine-protein kinase [Microbacterium telephonicum]RLK52378.1 serine/threonine protein kinase [Microbacterium telephonicum]
MSAKRPPAPPPQLPGFTYVDVLGSGGFADVYLFEQHLPRRRVAVKVMLPERMAGGSAEEFAAEANVMALLSTHPAIVTIHQAGVSDDGRPYLVMEYCPRPNLQIRSRAAAFSVAEALRVGVQVAAAVETAHRAGILHRDIKPANILVTEYNRPALTDFGIATTADAAASAGGMSIPWSPPEAFGDDPDSGRATDVYALSATVFTLLAGRSPFEVPGGRNGGADLIQRIERDPVPRIERADMPASLQVVLERAMSKRPADRYETAIAFARALQRVQIELAHSVTPIDILDDGTTDAADDDADGELTRVRGIVSIEPQTSPAAGQTRERQSSAPVFDSVPVFEDASRAPEETMLRGQTAPRPGEDAATVRRPRPLDPSAAAPAAAPSAPPADAPIAAPAAHPADAAAPAAAPARSRRGLWIGLGVGVAALIVAGIVVGASLLAPTADPQATPSQSPRPQNPVAGIVPAPADLVGAAAGADVTFTWTNPDPQDGDRYIWYPYTLDGDGSAAPVDEATVTLPADPSGRTCIAVQIVRAAGESGPETKACTP